MTPKGHLVWALEVEVEAVKRAMVNLSALCELAEEASVMLGQEQSGAELPDTSNACPHPQDGGQVMSSEEKRTLLPPKDLAAPPWVVIQQGTGSHVWWNVVREGMLYGSAGKSQIGDPWGNVISKTWAEAITVEANKLEAENADLRRQLEAIRTEIVRPHGNMGAVYDAGFIAGARYIQSRLAALLPPEAPR